MTSSGTVGAALLLLCVSATASSSSSEIFPPTGQFLDRSAFAQYGVLVVGSNVHGKLDIFVDLADPQCAQAWPALKSTAHDNEDTIEFVFHAIPFSDKPISTDYAMAAHLIADHSGDAEVETFFDLVFSYVRSLVRKGLGASFHYTSGDAEYDTITSTGSRQGSSDSIDDLDAGELLAAMVQSSSGMDSHQYESGMRDPAFDNLIRHGKTSSSTGSPPSSRLPLEGGAPPSVYLNGEFMAYLEGEEALDNFRLFLSRGVISEISDAKHRNRDDASYPLWREVRHTLQTMYDDDLRQRVRHDGFSSEIDSYYPSYAQLDAENVAVHVGDAASDEDVSPRPELEEDVDLVTSTSLVANDDVGAETSTWSLFPTWASLAMSQSSGSGTLSRYESDYYLYDDTMGEIRREQAADQGAGEPPSPRVENKQQAGVATPGQAEARLPPRSPSFEASGHGVSDDREREEATKNREADSVVPPPVSPPAAKIV
eukprot:g10020.t1